MNEAKLAYRLQDGCGAAVQNLLLDDTFVYNVDVQVRRDNYFASHRTLTLFSAS